MGATVIIHHPEITEDERNYRIAQIKRAVIEFYKEVEHGKSKTNVREKILETDSH